MIQTRYSEPFEGSKTPNFTLSSLQTLSCRFFLVLNVQSCSGHLLLLLLPQPIRPRFTTSASLWCTRTGSRCLAGKGMQRICSFPVSRSFRALAVPPRYLNYPTKPLKCLSVQMEKSNLSSSLSTESSAKPRGALIVLEGLDRSGKSTQCARLHSFLEGLGYPTELWRFPDRETSVGQMISAYLSNKSQLDDHTIHLLFSANRWEKRSLMEEKLKTGTTLVVDRYSYSGVAFSSAKGLEIDWCKSPEIGLLAPDSVLYLDISPERAAERGGYGDERYERVEFQKKVAGFYQTLHDSSWKIIDASEAMEEVEKKIQEVVIDKVKECSKGKPLSLLWSS